MSDIVTFRGGRKEAARVVRSLIASLTGQARSDAARGVFLAIGVAALSEIQGDFVRKSRGGTGQDGVKWQRLSPKTLAYSRRFGPGEKAQLKRDAGLGPANRFAPGGRASFESSISSTGFGSYQQNTGLLTAAQMKRWRMIFATRLARFAATMPMAQAKARAAAIAWSVLKSEGAKTKLEVFGNRPHEPLRDTGVLLNSLSVGTWSGDSYVKPNMDGGEQQIFEMEYNGVTVGTNVLYARTHNEGDPKRGIPARPFIPPPDRIPGVWLDNILAAGMRAVSSAIESTLIRGSA